MVQEISAEIFDYHVSGEYGPVLGSRLNCSRSVVGI
jgi:hypothetical protein